MPRHEYLYGQTLPQLEALCNRLEMPRFAAKQIARWLYDKHATTIEAMSDLSARHRALLAETYEVGLTAPEKVSISTDGTKKYLYRTSQNHFIESAYIPDGDRATLCISSQAGCRMGCRFCATGRQGLQHSLSTNEILNQIGSLPERERLTNVVFMGMGEPLDNLDSLLPALEVLTSARGFGWSPTRITVSTAGVASRLERFLEATQVHLAVSLHNPFPHERAEIMPVEKAWPIREVVEILRRYDFTHQRRVSFEYIVMSGLNDSPRHIRELCRLLDGIKCRINLIRFHKIPGSPYFSPDDRAMIAFRDALTAKGIHTTIRTSRGEDIQAACGLLSTAQNEAAQF
ncbi:23S rRNA (adenine(2503)-C(2))-methyltransferase RlmN [Alistipes putredinis]|uniref:23S rRNA (adenine(2503)-C(2))-methyltransferase RlmN n=1 Tax=Alistipes putredinis TaxID=28117 RepID=UPI002432296F|nr:23S rRNA (adenine(2503)-C(2))-methyltransferase RlmN [Alistipes putredinis]MBS6652261.1 23S rRNA (adenine(2503)-C(2))-methyltransferase RlmN [Alistipes putredinis]